LSPSLFGGSTPPRIEPGEPSVLSEKYQRVPTTAFSKGDIVHYTAIEQNRDFRVRVNQFTRKVVTKSGSYMVDIGNEMAAFYKTRYGLIVEVHSEPSVTVVPLYTFGGKGLSEKPEAEHNQYVNIKFELDNAYEKQHRLIPDEYTLLVESKPGCDWRPHKATVVSLAHFSVQRFGTRMEKVGVLVPERTIKAIELYLAYR
jgi:hypothetical protein